MRKSVLLGAIAGAALVSGAASAQSTLQQVKDRGQLNCGVNTGVVGFAAPEVGEHRIVLEGERSAERLNRSKRLVLCESAVACGNQALEFAFLAHQVPRDQGPDEQGRQAHGEDQVSSHGGWPILADEGTLPPRRGLTGQEYTDASTFLWRVGEERWRAELVGRR